MHKVARQQMLLALLSEKGQVSVADLAEKMQVSADTVRRDLTDLERQGLAQKNHGGAIALDLSAMNRQGRSHLLAQTKRSLGEAVAAQIPAGSTVFLDAGSTVLAVANVLRGPMTVITTSLDVAQCLSERADIQLILLGGSWDAKQRLFAGSATLSMLANYRADIAVLGTCAIHAQLGLSASQEADAEVKRTMLKLSAAHWLVADHLKLNRCEPHLIADLCDIHRLFIDRPWDELAEQDAIKVSVITSLAQGEKP